MSELEGENKVKDKNTIFDSSNIESRDKKELFTNIEGEAARKAAAEKAKAKAEKTAHENAIKEKAQEIEDAEKLDKKLKKAEQESNNPGRKNNKILNFFFGGWHKWVSVIFLLILVCLGIFLIIYVFAPKNSAERISEKSKNFDTYVEKCAAEESNAENMYCYETIQEIESVIWEEKDMDVRIAFLSEYEKLLIDRYGDYGRALDNLNRQDVGELNPTQQSVLKMIYRDVYYKSGDWENYEKYE